ncbi:MAG TPA: hypothetical protein VFU21_23150 [Kofleriaceae bacterium]|nr:hypothetical protein [Kofleriaceae bacterium]
MDVREASGAVWVPASHGLPAHVVVVGDSGTRGAFAIVDAETGAGLGKGNLPLGEGVSDDLEGFARAGDLYHGLVSNGRVRTWRRTGATAFELTGAPYSIHPELVCPGPKATNCRFDFEGLCLAATPGGGGCDGYAASRARGALVCVTVRPDGTLAADPNRIIEVAPPFVLSGCAIAPEGDRLYAGMNGLAANAVVRVAGWRDPDAARLEPLGPAGTGFCEGEAVGPGGVLYRFSDNRTSPSLMSALSCSPAAP